jgi:PemK-like, MazF-like toxin of type II toxin-antitoxin system
MRDVDRTRRWRANPVIQPNARGGSGDPNQPSDSQRLDASDASRATTEVRRLSDLKPHLPQAFGEVARITEGFRVDAEHGCILDATGQVRGHEQAGERPVLVLSHDVFNERSGTVIAVALTSQEPPRAIG